jgi:hypothetical protein
LLVEAADGLFGHRAIPVVDEGEAARAARFPIDWHDDLKRIADAGHVVAQLCFRCRVRQVPDKQTD